MAGQEFGHVGRLPAIVASPQDCGLEGGEFFPPTFGPELPGDQRGDDTLSLCLKREALGEPLDIVGAPELHLRLSSKQPQANIAVRLCDVHPDGAPAHVTAGVLNLAHCNSHAGTEKLAPYEDVFVRVRLDRCAFRLPAGHRLRVAISTAWWPMIWPAPEAATLTVAEVSLVLPVRPSSTGDETSFPEPGGAAPWATETMREASSQRRIERDHGIGLATLTIVDDFGELRDADHGLCNVSIVCETCTVHPDDPLTARGAARGTQALSRNE
jgi:predicted acyl esterase